MAGSPGGEKTVGRGEGPNKAFRLQDVLSFLRIGQNLAGERSRRAGSLGQSIADFTPQQTFTGSVPGSPSSLDVSNISDITQEKIDLLANVFLAREQQIAGRRAQPGRSGLILSAGQASRPSTLKRSPSRGVNLQSRLNTGRRTKPGPTELFKTPTLKATA